MSRSQQNDPRSDSRSTATSAGVEAEEIAETKLHVELEEGILRAAQDMKNVGVLKGINDRSTRKRPVA